MSSHMGDGYGYEDEKHCIYSRAADDKSYKDPSTHSMAATPSTPSSELFYHIRTSNASTKALRTPI